MRDLEELTEDHFRLKKEVEGLRRELDETKEQVKELKTSFAFTQQQQVVTVQPGMTALPGHPVITRWVSPPSTAVDCPPGLEFLASLDRIIVSQQMELLEMLSGSQMKNRYALLNDKGEQVYFAYEESDACQRHCCGAKRGYVMHVLDSQQRVHLILLKWVSTSQEVMVIQREMKCHCSCLAFLDCCADGSTIEAPPGNLIGFVRQRASCCVSAYTILDSSESPVLEIDGASCGQMCCCTDKEFPIYGLDAKHDEGRKIGSITKKWMGFTAENYTNADNFGVTFPLDMDVCTKALLVGATFLLDFMEFENKQVQRK